MLYKQLFRYLLWEKSRALGRFSAGLEVLTDHQVAGCIAIRERIRKVGKPGFGACPGRT
jgi:hypothetical protein